MGRDDAEVARRAAAIGRNVDELRANGLAGTGEIVDRSGRGGSAPVDRFYLQVLDLDDLDLIELMAAEVVPQLG